MADIFETLHGDHERLAGLLDELARHGRDDRVLAEVAREFSGHRAAEEEILYPRLETDPAVGDLIREGYVEHNVMASLLRETQQQASGDAEFRARARVLAELLRRHVRQEEDDVFLRARQVLPARDQIELNDAVNYERRRAA
jgi:hemerythrin-like domain-containing protein